MIKLYNPNADPLICKKSLKFAFEERKKYKIVAHRYFDHDEYKIVGDDGHTYWFTELSLDEYFGECGTIDNYDYAMGIV